METLAHNAAKKIAMQMDFDKDKTAVIAYGLTAIFQILAIFLIITVIGMLFGFWMESTIIFLGVGILRKSTGGAHSSTIGGCLIISVLSIVILSALSRYAFSLSINVWINIVISVMVFGICLIVFYLFVPVDSPNKPIVKSEKIKRLRRQSFVILTIGFLLSIACVFLTDRQERFYSIASSIRLAMLWQMFTLTKVGASFIHKIDFRISVVMAKK